MSDHKTHKTPAADANLIRNIRNCVARYRTEEAIEHARSMRPSCRNGCSEHDDIGVQFDPGERHVIGNALSGEIRLAYLMGGICISRHDTGGCTDIVSLNPEEALELCRFIDGLRKKSLLPSEEATGGGS